MALFRTYSAVIQGIDAHLIDVEVDMYPGGNSRDFVTVGMPDAAVKESRERIKSAMLNSGFGYPSKSVTVNLAPANLRKEGAGFDLPMATAILGAMGTVRHTDDYMIVGELSLDGTLRPVRGALSIAVCAARRGIRNVLVPLKNPAGNQEPDTGTRTRNALLRDLRCRGTRVRPAHPALGRPPAHHRRPRPNHRDNPRGPRPHPIRV